MKTNNNSIWDGMTNQYSLSKTLRFELRPIGKTKKFIENNKLIDLDEDRANKFLEVKKIMNAYFEEFINIRLNDVHLDDKKLNEFKEKYLELKKDNKNKDLIKSFEKITNELGTELYNVAGFNSFSKLNEKTVIPYLKIWLKLKNDVDALNQISYFDKWSTYFTGYFENRKNVFVKPSKDKDELAITCSIIYRTINQNLIFFLNNSIKFEELIKNYKDIDFTEIEENFKQELNGKSLKEFFKLKNYGSCLTQKGIDDFNEIIGGRTFENGIKWKGINEIINLYSQKNKNKEIRKKYKQTQLYKQILCNSRNKKGSFIPERLKDDQELIQLIKDIYLENKLNDSVGIKNALESIKNLFSSLEDYDLNGIYIKNNKSLSDISQKLFSDYNKLKNLIIEQEKRNPSDKKIINSINNKKISEDELLAKLYDWFKNKNYFSINEIDLAIINAGNENIFDEYKKKSDFLEKINSNFKHPLVGYLNKFEFANKSDEKSKLDKNNLFNRIEQSFEKINPLLNEDYSEETKNFIKVEKQSDVEKIKQFLDSIMDLFHFIKFINYKQGKERDWVNIDVDSDFYDEEKGYFKYYSEIKSITKIYDKVRNYVTQKPFNTKKFKLNFENATLCNGWDKNKEIDDWSVLFKKENNYYLGIFAKGHNKILLNYPNYSSGEYYEKMEYKLLPGPNKMLPKVFFSKKGVLEYAPSNEITDIYKKETFKKGDKFNLNDCRKLIDFYKKSLKNHSDWNNYFNFKFKDTKEYNDISEFYQDVKRQGYVIKFEKINADYINKLNEGGKLYLFQIWNKDFSNYSKGKKNLHTLYWNELFDENNIKNTIYSLNGEAELFYRRKSINQNITHPKNISIENKDPINGRKESKFDYDLIKDKRYAEDKYFFHCPITLNFSTKSNEFNINKKIVSTIQKNNTDVKVIGIDRGERHLAYYSLINQKGEIEKQGSFNIISDNFGRGRNYHSKLNKIECDRDDARKNWKKIENIKEMKTGYLSLVIHEIAKLVIENNAIIVLEDLNYGFKKGRFKIEKQIYQKFEKMLIDKLNYLVFKDRKGDCKGGLKKAYQLTSKFKSFKKIGNQTGVLFYVNPNYTSKIDPKTGFINLLYPVYENLESSKRFFEKFDSIRFNQKESYFEFNFDYSKFRLEEKTDILPEKTKWIICSYGERISSFRNKDQNNQWDYKRINLTNELKKIFDEKNIGYANGENIKNKILGINDVNFYKNLTTALKLILQLRNSMPGKKEEDYILSCVKNKGGQFFDSRKAKDNEPENADANGAYNIGLKGTMLIERISAQKEGDKINFKISNKDFFNWVVNRKNI